MHSWMEKHNIQSALENKSKVKYYWQLNVNSHKYQERVLDDGFPT